jgi:kinetochore protein Mis13/DSN1
MVLTRSPLEIIGMNSAGAQKRRSARLSHEENGEEEPPSKKSRTTGANAVAAAGSTKQPKATSKAKGSKKTKGNRWKESAAGNARANRGIVYDEEADGFAFTKGKRKKAPKDADAPEGAEAQPVQQAMLPPPPQTKKSDVPITAPIDANATKVQKKTRRKLPSTPERDVPEKTTRRSKRGSSEMENVEAAPSPQQEQRGRRKPNAERSPSAEGAQPLTVEKKRTQGSGVVEEEKVMRIMLPFADTPIIRKNRAMRKASAENHRRSSSGMRGRRASSLIDEGRGHGMFAHILSYVR